MTDKQRHWGEARMGREVSRAEKGLQSCLMMQEVVRLQTGFSLQRLPRWKQQPLNEKNYGGMFYHRPDKEDFLFTFAVTDRLVLLVTTGGKKPGLI
jgi:hypothetical protein